MGDSREGKAERIVMRQELKELDVILEAQIMKYNDLATQLGDEDIIVAYKMTHDDLNKVMKEMFDGEQTEDQDNTE